ncbi:MAG: 2TM domain-containing protein [Actinomycetota bacterium]
MAYCHRCGKEVEAGDAFCHACGSAISGTARVAVGEAAAATDATAPPAPMPPRAAQPYGEQARAETPQEIAERRVKQKLELWWHLGSYVIVNVFLIIIWAITGAGYPWFVWVMIGWGIGVAFHLMHYFMDVHGESRRQRMIQKEMDRLQRRQDA